MGPNIFIITNHALEVKGIFSTSNNFCVIYNLVLFTLYNIASCKIQNRRLLYSYKEVIPMYT